jgi:hypothetical protein
MILRDPDFQIIKQPWKARYWCVLEGGDTKKVKKYYVNEEFSFGSKWTRAILWEDGRIDYRIIKGLF